MGNSSKKPSPPPSPVYSYRASSTSYSFSTAPPAAATTVPTKKYYAPATPTPAPAPQPIPRTARLINLAPPVPTPAPVKTPPCPKTATRLVNFDANNYIITNEVSQNQSTVFIPSISVPFRARVDKFSMRVCPQYNNIKGCYMDHCYRFHVCQFWVKGDCKKPNCSYDHDFRNSHNYPLLQPHIRRNFGEAQLLESLRKGSFIGKSRPREMANCLCVDYIYKTCRRSPCNYHHADSPFAWEINIDDKWERFSRKHNNELEKAFSDPLNVTIILSKMPDKQNVKAKLSLLEQALGIGDSKVDFEKLSLISSNSYFRIRRLSTPSDIAHSKSIATRWLWYWKDTGDVWRAYQSGTFNEFFIIPLSDHLEFLFLKGTKEITVTMNDTPYTLNLEQRTQTNNNTNYVRTMRRRPTFSAVIDKWNDNTTFHSLWTKNPDKSLKFTRNVINSSSPEHAFAKKMLQQTLSPITDLKVERIENSFLWDGYQLKKRQLLDKYGDDLTLVNEQYLFHGTKDAVVDKICTDGFDWRLFGSNVGNVYGQGTYFANNSSLSNSYAATDDEGYKCMFITLVLVGVATIGNSKMKIPPKNPATDKWFDTTVDDYTSPQIFVKYNLDDYYPAYYVRYKTS